MSAPSPDISVQCRGLLGYELANELKTILATPTTMSDQLFKQLQMISGGHALNIQSFITGSGTPAVKESALEGLTQNFGRATAYAIANYYA